MADNTKNKNGNSETVPGTDTGKRAPLKAPGVVEREGRSGGNHQAGDPARGADSRTGKLYQPANSPKRDSKEDNSPCITQKP